MDANICTVYRFAHYQPPPGTFYLCCPLTAHFRHRTSAFDSMVASSSGLRLFGSVRAADKKTFSAT